MNSFHTAKKARRFSSAEVKWLMQFEKMIPIYSETHTTFLNTKRSVIEF
jgi:hypothetical protein